MFFIFSKLLSFIITPIIWIIILFVISIYSKKERRRKRSFAWALGLLLFFSNSFIFDECIRMWEIPATKYENLKVYDAGIVLGGMAAYDQSFQRAQFYRGADRLIQAVELYRKGIIKKIIFTGGSGSILHSEIKEGNFINRYLLYFGIPQKDFLIESESQNTRQNALYTKQLLDKEKMSGNYLLITSAFHMRRSLGCFNKVGIATVPYSTDRYAGPRKFEFDYLFIPNSSVMNDWNTLIHEIIGYITYKISGYC
ncbi:MAG: YdcF family protein [Bacteroidia bacterium]